MGCKQISKKESLNLRITWVSFLNVSLRMYADVIASRQFHQTLKKTNRNFMNKNVNPPCNSSLATSCTKSIMGSSEVRVSTFFTEGVSSSAEGELVIDETSSTVSLAQNVCVVPGVSAAVEESEECVGEIVRPVIGGQHLGTISFFKICI